MDSYMIDYGYCFMVCQYLRQVHLQEVDPTQFMVNHGRVEDLRQLA